MFKMKKNTEKDGSNYSTENSMRCSKKSTEKNLFRNSLLNIICITLLFCITSIWLGSIIYVNAQPNDSVHENPLKRFLKKLDGKAFDECFGKIKMILDKIYILQSILPLTNNMHIILTELMILCLIVLYSNTRLKFVYYIKLSAQLYLYVQLAAQTFIVLNFIILKIEELPAPKPEVMLSAIIITIFQLIPRLFILLNISYHSNLAIRSSADVKFKIASRPQVIPLITLELAILLLTGYSILLDSVNLTIIYIISSSAIFLFIFCASFNAMTVARSIENKITTKKEKSSTMNSIRYRINYAFIDSFFGTLIAIGIGLAMCCLYKNDQFSIVEAVMEIFHCEHNHVYYLIPWLDFLGSFLITSTLSMQIFKEWKYRNLFSNNVF